MRMYKRPFLEWNVKTIRELMSLTLDDNLLGESLMRQAIQRRPEGLETYVMKEKGESIAWAAIDGPLIMIYVRPDYRRKGIGSKLYRAAKRDYPKGFVQDWDSQSYEFFSSLGAL